MRVTNWHKADSNRCAHWHEAVMVLGDAPQLSAIHTTESNIPFIAIKRDGMAMRVYLSPSDIDFLLEDLQKLKSK